SFRAYRTVAQSVDDHGKLLATSGSYRRAMAVRGNPNAFASSLTGTYATDPGYGAKLIRLMQQYDLYRYDTVSGAQRANAAPPASGASAGPTTGQPGSLAASPTTTPAVPGTAPSAPGSSAPGMAASGVSAQSAWIPGTSIPGASAAGSAPSGSGRAGSAKGAPHSASGGARTSPAPARRPTASPTAPPRASASAPGSPPPPPAPPPTPTAHAPP